MQPSPSTSELDDVVALIAAQQARPERNISYVGTAAASLRAELDALDPPWAETLRTVRAADGSLVGAIAVEWDDKLHRAWIHGPWVSETDDAWSEHADQLFDDALEQLPTGIDDVELSGDVAHVQLERLAERRSLQASDVVHALMIEARIVNDWPTLETSALRAAHAGDLDHVRRLHDAEFPNTLYSADDLVTGAQTGGHIVIVAEIENAIVGYASGRVLPDGEGYIDFVAVDPAFRSGGLGRLLVASLTLALLERATRPQVSLTVQGERPSARALYASLGFQLDASFRAYRGRPS